MSQGFTTPLPIPLPVNQGGTGVVTSTGTGNTVLSNNPTLSSPIINQINDTNGNQIVNLTPVASAVNYLLLANANAGGQCNINTEGTDSNIPLALVPKGTGQTKLYSTNAQPVLFVSGTAFQHATAFAFANTAASQTVTFPDATGTVLMTGQAISTVPSIAFSSTTGIVGTTTNDNAATGSVGEYVTSNIAAASAVSCTNTVARNVTSISLTAGDWDIFGNVKFTPTNTTSFTYYCWTSTTSATLPDNSLNNVTAIGSSAGGVSGMNTPYLRVSIASTTTVYLSCRADFAGSSPTVTACGSIFARRVR